MNILEPGCLAKLVALVDGLPDGVGDMLLMYRDALTVQGSVLSRNDPDRRPSWRLRFRAWDEKAGLNRHSSVSLGRDPAVAARVESILEKFRAERLAQKTEEMTEQARVQVLKRNYNRMKRLIGITVRGARQRRQAWADYQKAVETGDPLIVMTFVNALPNMYPPAKAGRPIRNNLW